MWFNQKSSYFLDTFGKQSRYLSKLISGNNGLNVSVSVIAPFRFGGVVFLKVRIFFSRRVGGCYAALMRP